MSDEIREALSFIPPEDRDTWVQVGFAIKDELGAAGFDLWDQWSQQADNYRSADAKSVWRSMRGRGVTIATLYKFARENGWTGTGAAARRERPVRRQEPNDEWRREKARRKAQALVSAAYMHTHPYLVTKGFPEAQGLVLDGLLIIPMRDMKTGALNSAQTITFDGEKKFLAGGKARGSVFVMGAGAETYLCEGYATGLSVRVALQSLYRQARVVVCFSAANIAHVAAFLGDYVVADHDASQTGERYAEKSNLPWWMPPEAGDANDYHAKHGVRALAIAINELRVKNNSLRREERTAGNGSR